MSPKDVESIIIEYIDEFPKNKSQIAYLQNDYTQIDEYSVRCTDRGVRYINKSRCVSGIEINIAKCLIKQVIQQENTLNKAIIANKVNELIKQTKDSVVDTLAEETIDYMNENHPHYFEVHSIDDLKEGIKHWLNQDNNPYLSLSFDIVRSGQVDALATNLDDDSNLNVLIYDYFINNTDYTGSLIKKALSDENDDLDYQLLQDRADSYHYYNVKALKKYLKELNIDKNEFVVTTSMMGTINVKYLLAGDERFDIALCPISESFTVDDIEQELQDLEDINHVLLSKGITPETNNAKYQNDFESTVKKLYNKNIDIEELGFPFQEGTYDDTYVIKYPSGDVIELS